MLANAILSVFQVITRSKSLFQLTIYLKTYSILTDLWYDGGNFASFYSKKGHIVMLGFFLSALLAVAPAQMQATTQTAAEAAAKTPVVSSGKVSNPAKPELSPTSPVITIHGLCQAAKTAKAGASACSTAVTKEQFDSVVTALNAIGPQLLAPQRRVVAEGYANMLVNADAARKAGVERDPRFAEVMRLARLRAMGDMYNALMITRAQKVSAQEIQNYFEKNSGKFEELQLRRITLPRYNMANLKDDKFAAKARKIAEDVQARAAKGEDPDKLQEEAFKSLSVINPPTTKMGPVRRGMYVEDQEKQIFALKPGEVTSIIEQPSSFSIFKLEGRRSLTLDEAKPEITQMLIKQHMEKQKEASAKAVKIDYDDQYVGAPNSTAWMPATPVNGDKKPAPKPAAQNSQPPKK